MSQNVSSGAPSAGLKNRGSLSEDWLATIIGLLIVLVIGLGLLGPGPQNVSLKAGAGEVKSVPARPLSGWSVSATVGGEKASIENAPKTLASGQNVLFTCRERALVVESVETLPEGVAAPEAGRALLILVNECTTEAAVTYRTNPAVPWPVFNLFNR